MLPQAVSKEPINHLTQKVSYDSMMIDPVINAFIHNKTSSNLHIYDPSTATF